MSICKNCLYNCPMFYWCYIFCLFKIYDTELEKAEGHGDFADFCHSFNFSRGKDEEDEESNIVGELKVEIIKIL